jgi:hypothetical protein
VPKSPAFPNPSAERIPCPGNFAAFAGYGILGANSLDLTPAPRVGHVGFLDIVPRSFMEERRVELSSSRRKVIGSSLVHSFGPTHRHVLPYENAFSRPFA